MLTITGPQGSVVLTRVDLAGLEQVQLSNEGNRGPLLREVLRLGGAGSYSSVTAKGVTIDTLTKEQVDDQSTIVDFTNRGTLKVASEIIPKVRWVKDVKTVEVTP